MSTDEPVCCPPQQTTSAPVKAGPAHPVSAKTGYELKGTIQKLGDFDEVYVVRFLVYEPHLERESNHLTAQTGAEESNHALVVIYDVFGFWETTMRGSDLLGSHLLLTRPTTIFMPDVFRGHPLSKEDDGNKEVLQKFFAGTAKLSDRLPEVIKFANFLKEEKGFTSVGIQGYCWGGKLALLALSSTLPSPSSFCCGALVHPAMIAVEDGENLSRPLALYPSHDEPKDVVDEIHTAMGKKNFASKCDYHLYDTVHHGWAAARADLNDPENLKQYEDVYQRLADYFSGQ